MTTILICDERRHVREALTRAMSTVPGVRDIDTLASARDLVPRYVHRPAALTLVRVERDRSHGFAAIRQLLTGNPEASILAFGTLEDVPRAIEAINAGARGFLRWDTDQPVAALVSAIAPLTDTLTRPVAPSNIQLTERELQVLQAISAGKSNGQIGNELYLSEDTIKTHARRVYRKLAVKDRAEAVAKAFRHGLIG